MRQMEVNRAVTGRTLLSYPHLRRPGGSRRRCSPLFTHSVLEVSSQIHPNPHKSRPFDLFGGIVSVSRSSVFPLLALRLARNGSPSPLGLGSSSAEELPDEVIEELPAAAGARGDGGRSRGRWSEAGGGSARVEHL